MSTFRESDTHMTTLESGRTNGPRLQRARRALHARAAPLRAGLLVASAVLAGAVALAPATATAAGAKLTSGDYSGSEGTVHYQLYVPSSYSPTTSVPLVVALHGCTQTADGFRQLTRWDTLAEAKGFIVVFPEQDTGSNSLRCWNFFADSSMHRGSGDAARIAAVTSLVENTYDVDPHRVFVNGLSAGGGMASVMAATYPDYFAAIGIGSGCEYAATATCAGYQSADPTQASQAAYREMGVRAHPMPFIDFQGDQDTTVPPVNADQRVQQWLLTNDLADDGVANHSVTTKATSTTSGGSGSRTYAVSTYSDSAKHELGTRWVVHGMGHAWSGGNASQPYSDPAGPDETGAMYDFFMRHPDTSLTRPAAPAVSQPPTPSPDPSTDPSPEPGIDPSPTPAPEPGSSSSSSPAQPSAGESAPANDHSQVPTVSNVKLSHGRVVLTLSGPGSVTLRLQRALAGRCETSAGKHRACTRYSTRATVARTTAKGGRITIAVPKHAHGRRLPRGRYRALVTAADHAGHTGNSRTLAVVMH
jgi:poly(hydroxyalkanoate) depolymerase family esterase